MVGRPAKLTSTHRESVIRFETTAFSTCILDSFAQVLELFSLFLASLLLVLHLLELETLLAHTDELLTIELLKLSDGLFVNGINQQESFEALLLEYGESQTDAIDSPVR